MFPTIEVSSWIDALGIPSPVNEGDGISYSALSHRVEKSYERAMRSQGDMTTTRGHMVHILAS